MFRSYDDWKSDRGEPMFDDESIVEYVDNLDPIELIEKALDYGLDKTVDDALKSVRESLIEIIEENNDDF